MCQGWYRKHPHGRGEDLYRDGISPVRVETPPRAWGRLLLGPANPSAIGNTPTGVGKTPADWPQAGHYQKHPHGRGEDERRRGLSYGFGETPPRAWGRPPMSKKVPAQRRNTPTGVGKTLAWHAVTTGTKKHPHGRGEDELVGESNIGKSETPPRAWGRRTTATHSWLQHGNTPTGVGKTWRARCIPAPWRKNPHGRGEDASVAGH